MIKEFCAENYTLIAKAIAAGAMRIELCDNLAAGGTTPSYGVIKATLAYTKPLAIPVMVMIRPRGGNFTYNDQELQIMLNEIKLCQQLGADGVVFGLIKNSWIDEAATVQLIQAAKPLSITFHMAFDEIEPQLQYDAIDWLAKQGVDRILTHGGPLEHPIEDHFPTLKKLVDYAAGKLMILPGGGIHTENVDEIATFLGVHEVHGTRIVKL